MSAPLVSVIMPAFRCAQFLPESVGSVLAQTMPDLEVLIADDCSPDDTYEQALVLAERDGRVRVLRTNTNAGPAAARNLALEEARGRYAAFLDADDGWYPEKLAAQIDFMRERNAAFSCTAYDRVDESGRFLGRVTPFDSADYDRVLFTANPVGNSTAMIDREILGDLRVPPIRKRNDFALWLAALRRVDLVYGMREILGFYRVRENSVSSDKAALLRYHWELYRDVERLSLPKTLAAFAGIAYTQIFRPTWRATGEERRKGGSP